MTDQTPKATRNQETRRLSFMPSSMSAGAFRFRRGGVGSLTPMGADPVVRGPGGALYVRRVLMTTTAAASRRALAVSMTAALLGGTVLAGTAAAAPKPT